MPDWMSLVDNRPFTQVEVDGMLLDLELNFCYLGDMLCAGRGCKLAVITRCVIACGKLSGFFLCWHQSMCPSAPMGKAPMPVYVLPYNMEVKPRHRLHHTYSCLAGTTDQWSTGYAKSEVTIRWQRTHSGLCCQLGMQEVTAALHTRLYVPLHAQALSQVWRFLEPEEEGDVRSPGLSVLRLTWKCAALAALILWTEKRGCRRVWVFDTLATCCLPQYLGHQQQ